MVKTFTAINKMNVFHAVKSLVPYVRLQPQLTLLHEFDWQPLKYLHHLKKQINCHKET